MCIVREPLEDKVKEKENISTEAIHVPQLAIWIKRFILMVDNFHVSKYILLMVLCDGTNLGIYYRLLLM